MFSHLHEAASRRFGIVAFAMGAALAAASCSNQMLTTPASGGNAAPASGGTSTPTRILGDIGSGGTGISPVNTSFSLTAANGDELVGDANLVVGRGGCFHGRNAPNLFGGCFISHGTGRFAGATSLSGDVATDGTYLDFYFEIVSPGQLLVNAVFNAPLLGDQNFVVTKMMNIDAMTANTDSSCNSGSRVRLDFSGQLEQFGRTVGFLSYCSL